jgi:hypothetical protein
MINVTRGILALTICSALPCFSSHSVARSKKEKPPALGHLEITNAEFVREYGLCDLRVAARPEKVFAVVQTFSHAKLKSSEFTRTRLDDFVFQYTTADSATGSAPAFAVGGDLGTLTSGGSMRVWISRHLNLNPRVQVDTTIDGVAVDGDVMNCVVPVAIDGLTVVAVLPQNVTSFKLCKLSRQSIGLVSKMIQRTTDPPGRSASRRESPGVDGAGPQVGGEGAYGQPGALTETPNSQPAIQLKASGTVSGQDARLVEPADLLPGRNPVRVVNPNDFAVDVELRCQGRSRRFNVQANGTATANVANGTYEVFFVFSNEAKARYQGDGFTLSNNGVEVRVVKATNGNYSIRRVR